MCSWWKSRVSTAKPNWITVGSSQLPNWQLKFKIQDSGRTVRHLETECMSFRVFPMSERFLDSGNHAGVLLYNRCVAIQSRKNLNKFRGHWWKNNITASVFESQNGGCCHLEFWKTDAVLSVFDQLRPNLVGMFRHFLTGNTPLI